MRLGWPWLIVGAAWTTTIIATLSGWRILIDHHYLLEESGLPWAVAAVVFLVGWQVMLVAMMAPSGVLIMPGIPADWGKHHYSSRSFALFFAGYASAWTVFGLLAFAGDTLIHRLVDSWPWLSRWLASSSSLPGRPFALRAANRSMIQARRLRAHALPGGRAFAMERYRSAAAGR
jgi:predicted metal-binding membrane protein